MAGWGTGLMINRLLLSSSTAIDPSVEKILSVRCVFFHKEITILTCHCEVCEVQCIRQALAGCIFSSRLERLCTFSDLRDGCINFFFRTLPRPS